MRKSITELSAQADATIEDNTIGAVSPADVRNMVKDFLDAIRPAYGIITQTGNPTQNLGTTPVKMLFNNRQDSDIDETNSSAADGRVSVLNPGVEEVTFTVDVECTAGRFISAVLYKNGIATPWRVTTTGAGNGNPVGMSLAAYVADAAAHTLEIFLSAEQANTATIVSNGSMIVAVKPVNDYGTLPP